MLGILARHQGTFETPSKVPQYAAIVSEMEECIDNLAPPSVALQLRGQTDEVYNFWLLMYAVWRFRLDPIRFSGFAKRHEWGDDLGRAEEVLGNLLLQALQALEIRFQWEVSKVKRPEL